MRLLILLLLTLWFLLICQMQSQWPLIQNSIL
jgi:hypothetical protein